MERILRPVNNFRYFALRVAAAMLIATACGPNALGQAPVSPPAGADETVTLNFANADLQAVIKAVAEITGRNILIDPRVTGTVTIVSPRPVPRRLVWGILLSALRAQGFTAISDNLGVWSIVPEGDAKFFGGRRGQPEGDQVVTEVFMLENERAQQVVPLLRPLISPNNVVNAAPSANALIVTDYAENMARIRRIIAEIDRPTGGEIVAIPLKHASATDFIQVVQRLVPDAVTAAGTQGAAPRLALAVDARTNSILVRADNPTLAARIRSLVATLDSPTSQLGNIHVVFLRNADATRLAESLRAMLSGLPGQAAAAPSSTPTPAGGQFGQTLGTGTQAQGASPTGQGIMGSPVAVGPLGTLPPITSGTSPGGVTIQAYPEQNSVIIVAPDALYNALRAVIDKLDTRRAQVFVETLIVEVRADKTAEFGIQWQSLGGLNRSTTSVIGAQNFTNVPNANINSVSQALPSLAQGLSLGVVNGIITVAGQQIFNLQALARALEADVNANILSTPNLITLDNEEARIIVGQNVPIITGSFTLAGSGSGVVNPFQTVTRQDIGVALRVRPQVAEGDTVKLGLYQEVSSIFDQNNPDGIILNKRALETQVVVDDGQMIVLGGLIQDEVDSTVQKVPVLGDVPLIGWLFRYSTRKRERTNLLVFLRPVVIRDSEAAGRLTGERYDYIRDTQRANRLPPSAVLPHMPVPELPPVMDLRGTKNPPPERGSSQLSPDRQQPSQPPASPPRGQPSAAQRQSAPNSAEPSAGESSAAQQETMPLPWDTGQPSPP
jgi:general secretion pathway protein D